MKEPNLQKARRELEYTGGRRYCFGRPIVLKQELHSAGKAQCEIYLALDCKYVAQDRYALFQETISNRQPHGD